jgi:hypothetical protein
MKRQTPPARSRALLMRSLVAAAVAMACAGAHAQLRPYYVTASETIGYDSNLFRVSDDEESDMYSTTSLVLGVDQPIGRQRVFGSFGANYTAYRDNSQLDGTGYNIGLGLDWEAASRLSGTARLRFAEALPGFGDYGAEQGVDTERNEEQSKTADFSVVYGGAALLSLQGFANYTDIDYSRNDFSNRERKSHMFGAGVRYHPGGPWSFGLSVRRTNGEYPEFTSSTGQTTLSDDFDRTDVDLSAVYVATGKSNFSIRLSKTKEDHERDEERDFDDWTGELSWRYRATGKLSLGLGLTRETGSGSSFSSGPVVTDPDVPPPPNPAVTYLTDSTRTDTIRLDANWTATGRIGVSAGLSYSRDHYDNRFLTDDGSGSSGSSGHSNSYYLSATYDITRVWSANCGIGYERRSSAAQVDGSDYGYGATTGHCTVTLALR